MSSDQQDVPKKRGGVRRKASPGQKRPRRSDYKFPYLEPSVALLKRRDEVDDVSSYTDKLNEDEKAWLNQFMREYNDADTKNAIFHTDAVTRKICNDKNNARNRCWYTEEAAANRLNLVESDYEMERLVHGQLEDADDYVFDRDEED